MKDTRTADRETARPVVVVTGGTTRLGKVIADHLETVGWRVLRTSHRSDAGADVVVDLSQPQGAEVLFESLGCVPDALVNNAGVFAGNRVLNVETPVRLMARMADVGGTVVNILDCRVLRGLPSDAYAQDKFDLWVATQQFATKMRVNAVAPGPVLVPTAVHEKAGATPLGRPTPQAVAEAVAFLLSAKSTTGCIIPVDGGQSLVK